MEWKMGGNTNIKYLEYSKAIVIWLHTMCKANNGYDWTESKEWAAFRSLDSSHWFDLNLKPYTSYSEAH